MDTSSASGGRRALNREIFLIPFIDFLLCLVSFLLITAVWSQMARLQANANVPGPPGDHPPSEERVLHVELKSARDFTLAWKSGATVIDTIDVPKDAVESGDLLRYPQLQAALLQQWKAHGNHQGRFDPGLDRAVLHASNASEFREIAAVIDALHGVTREYSRAGATHTVPAFNVSFAVN